MEKGFNKISLEDKTEENKSVKMVDNKTEIKPHVKAIMLKKKNNKLKILIIGLFVTVLIILGLFFPSKRLYDQVIKTKDSAGLVLTAVKNQNIEETKTELEKTRIQLKNTQKAYSFFGFLKIIPFIGGYYKDGEHLLLAGEAGIEGAQISVDALIPYADLLGLKGESAFVSGSADQRIQTAVSTLDKLTPKLGEIAIKIGIVKDNLDKINVNRYPQKWGKREIRKPLQDFKTTFDGISTLFINARPLLENLPNILGSTTPKRYLVLFQNDKELRPTGGFITAYALFKVDKGKLIVETSDDIYKLDDKYKPTMSPPQEFINHLKVYKLQLRDANYDPDFKDSMIRFTQMYDTIGQVSKYDGIIALDTHVLVEAMKILGPIPAYGTNFTVENDPRCDCPKVIYDLEEYAGKRVGYIRESRKDIIGVLLYQIMQKALGVSPSQYWGNLFQMMLSEFNQKHILIYLNDEKAQQSLEALNFAGKIVDVPSGDYLHINDANLGGAKSNMFVKHVIKQEYEKDKDGSIIKTLTIDYKNPNEGSKGCNLEAGGLCLNGLMPNWVRIYVPKGSTLIDFQGSEDPPTVSEAYNKTVFNGFLTVKPNNISQIKIKYKLPFTDSGKAFPLYIQKQPGTEGHEVTTLVSGKDLGILTLTEDKKLDIKL